jgi:FdhD protein
MRDETRFLKVLRVDGKGATKERDLVARESPVTIFVNDVDLVTLLCSPKDIECLAVGFLFTEGLINGKEDIRSILADEDEGVVWVETVGGKEPPGDILAKRVVTTGCGRGWSLMDSSSLKKVLKRAGDLKVESGQVALLMKEFQEKSMVYKRTGGVHSAGLADHRGIVAFGEDVGRHNAIDKVLGRCILESVDTKGLVLMTSGRVTSDLLIKAARAGIPIIISRSAPTDISVRLARNLGVTLVGFARGSRMNVYSNEWRIVTRAKLQ